jgi:hypothetical protein
MTRPACSPVLREHERGSALVVALLLMVLLFTLGAALFTMAETEGVIAANDVWAEGSFYAAEAAVQEAVDQITDDRATLELVVDSSPIGGDYTYRSGGQDDTTPQPPQFVDIVQRAGFAIGGGTGYNPTSFNFAIYRINGTGTGPRSAVREVEVQIELGPMAQ